MIRINVAYVQINLHNNKSHKSIINTNEQMKERDRIIIAEIIDVFSFRKIVHYLTGDQCWNYKKKIIC